MNTAADNAVIALEEAAGAAINRLEQRAAFTEEVSRLEATAKNWRKKAGRANLTECGGQLCVEVDERAGRWTVGNDQSRPLAVIKDY